MRNTTRNTTLAILLVLMTTTPGLAQRRPSLVPEGWTQVSIDQETKTRRFASPDGRSWLVAKQSIARGSALNRDMQDLAGRAGETVTYQRRGASWIAVSGYREDQIFYRKSNLACGGTRWHHIELQYPRSEKRRMDATVTAIARGMTLYHDDCPKIRCWRARREREPSKRLCVN
jgi:hypothetical protein